MDNFQAKQIKQIVSKVKTIPDTFHIYAAGPSAVTPDFLPGKCLPPKIYNANSGALYLSNGNVLG